MQKLSGIFIFLSLISSLWAYFVNESILVLAGIFIWSSFLLLLKDLKNKNLIFLILFISFILFIFCQNKGIEIDYKRVFTINQYLISLLIAVSFLKIISKPKNENIKHLPKGKKAFYKTYLGVHFFGSVINLSALLLVADKLYKKAPLNKMQLILLTRAFSSDAYWSPFFIAFGVAITYAPNLSYPIILFSGSILAVCAFFITIAEVNVKYDIKEFRGYPISFETSYIPILLAICVLVFSYIYENSQLIVIISSFALVLTAIILPIKKGFRNSFNILKIFILEDLPLMKMEISLFIVAGMFGVLASSFISYFELISNVLDFEVFSWIHASLLLAFFILLAFIGIHPIISISIFANSLLDVNHTLLAMTFLMAWATTVSTSPFSGLNLTLQSRYKINSIELIKVNFVYLIIMYIISVLILYEFSNSFTLY